MTKVLQLFSSHFSNYFFSFSLFFHRLPFVYNFQSDEFRWHTAYVNFHSSSSFIVQFPSARVGFYLHSFICFIVLSPLTSVLSNSHVKTNHYFYSFTRFIAAFLFILMLPNVFMHDFHSFIPFIAASLLQHINALMRVLIKLSTRSSLSPLHSVTAAFHH